MSESSPSWELVIGELIDSRLLEVGTAIPGRVESYDKDQQRASVKPLLKRGFIDESGERDTEELPIVNDVPVVFCGMTFPIDKGVSVLLIVSQASLDRWLQQGGLVDPNDDRHHNMSDVFAIPGLNSFNEATDQVKDGAKVIPSPNGGELLLGSKDASEAVLHGTTYVPAEKVMLDAMKVYFTALGAATLTAPGAAVVNAAIDVFKAGSYLSTSVKAD